MSTFEFSNENEVLSSRECDRLDPQRLREECIVALKVYDSIRGQECLTPDEIGPARAAEDHCEGDNQTAEGEVIIPPSNAATVSVDRLKIKKIIIVSKEPSAFRNGFWDIDIKFVFEYRLTFREADGSVIYTVKANSIYNKRTTLFGSYGTDLVVGTDLLAGVLGGHGHGHGQSESLTIDADPFILVEAKAVALNSELKYRRRPSNDDDNGAVSVDVTIGLFFIIKLIRLVNLTVESKGFCIPVEEEELSPLDACGFFESLDFPMDVFAPPQKPEFFCGISGDIKGVSDDDCGCHKHEHDHDCHEHEHDHDCGCHKKRR